MKVGAGSEVGSLRPQESGAFEETCVRKWGARWAMKRASVKNDPDRLKVTGAEGMKFLPSSPVISGFYSTSGHSVIVRHSSSPA